MGSTRLGQSAAASPCPESVLWIGVSVVQWHSFCRFFLMAAPLKIVFPKKGSLFSRVTEQLSNFNTQVWNTSAERNNGYELPASAQLLDA